MVQKQNHWKSKFQNVWYSDVVSIWKFWILAPTVQPIMDSKTPAQKMYI